MTTQLTERLPAGRQEANVSLWPNLPLTLRSNVKGSIRTHSLRRPPQSKADSVSYVLIEEVMGWQINLRFILSM